MRFLWKSVVDELIKGFFRMGHLKIMELIRSRIPVVMYLFFDVKYNHPGWIIITLCKVRHD